MSERFSTHALQRKDELNYIQIIDGNEPLTITEVKNLLNEFDDITQELYDFRFIYNCLLFNTWNETGEVEVYKSKKHHDGEPCFDGEYFIVVALLPTGQITNHYPMKYWDCFKIPSYNQVKDEFDGHSSKDVLNRLMNYLNGEHI